VPFLAISMRHRAGPRARPGYFRTPYLGVAPQLLEAVLDRALELRVAPRLGVQSYPAAQAGSGTPCWGELRVPDVQFIDDRRECLTDLAGLHRAGLIRTSNPGGVPDSIRIFLGKQQQCFRFGIGAGCSPIDGAYFDNVSVGFVNLPDKLELDEFPNTVAHVDITGPVSDSSVVLSGPTAVHVYLSSLSDPDGNGREQVQTEMVQLNLMGSSPSIGPMTVRLRPTLKHPYVRSVGEIEETTNTLASRLDLPPFAPSGTASSFFDVFFEVDLPALGLVLHNHEAHRVSSVIKHKPPEGDEVYLDLHPIRLYDEDEQPTPYYIGAKHFPVPPPERDTFPDSWGAIELVTDSGSEFVNLRGPVRVDVDTSRVVDVDSDTREEFPTEMLELQLTGTSSLGPVVVTLRDPAQHPNQRTVGRIEETANLTPQRLDLRPFVKRDTTTATSFFDVFFQVDLPALGLEYHNHSAKPMSGVIRNKPPAPGDDYQSAPAIVTDLFDQNENLAPVKVRRGIHRGSSVTPSPNLTSWWMWKGRGGSISCWRGGRRGSTCRPTPPAGRSTSTATGGTRS